MNKNIFLSVLAAILLLNTSLCLAAETYYKIEVLAFKQTGNQPLAAEDWQGDNISKQLSKAILLQNNNSEQSSGVPIYQRLPEQQWDLRKEHQTLSHRNGYQLLTHVAWIQPANAKEVRLTGGKQLPLQQQQMSTAIAWELDGIIKATLSHGRYFTIETNLALSKPMNETTGLSYYDAIPTVNFQHYYLRQTQGLQSGELHYFDHPAFGLLVKITPYEG